MSNPEPTQAHPRRRWDPLVRLTHWGIAAGVIANRLVVEGGSGLHLWFGLAIAALLGLRLAWGFIGPPEARFAAFPPSPRRALEHIGDIRASRRTVHASHNPLGALMAYALWGTLAVVIASGIAMSGFPPQVRPEPGGDPAMASAGLGESDDEASEANGGAGEAVEEIHEGAANLLLILAFVHLGGVVFETRRSGRQVLSSMIGGGSNPRER
jgi:cytochrome b